MAAGFWEAVATKVKELHMINHIDLSPTADEDMLRLNFGRAVLSELLGHDGYLQCHYEGRCNRIAKQQYKVYPSTCFHVFKRFL